ncbi:MAG TPA: pyruvate kinase [Actinomycetota bacterium]
MSFESVRVMCTLGPASLDPDVIRALEARDVDLFRINLSHTGLDEIEPAVELIRRHADVPISLDTEGAQVRCGPVVTDLTLETGTSVELVPDDVVGTAERLTLRPRSVFDALDRGAEVAIDFHGATLRVVERTRDGVRAVVERGGRVGSNRAVTVDPAPPLPPLTGKDLQALAIGVGLGIEDYALSFASSIDDVELIRRTIPPGARLISKIESRAGVLRMDEIIQGSDAVLIDRGDLSREIPLDEIPYFQKMLVRRANRWRRPLYVATNLLESMVLNSRPTVAEANDIANTLLDGAHGLVLAAETAIGVDPVGAVDMVRRCIAAFERANFAAPLARMPASASPPTVGSSVA